MFSLSAPRRLTRFADLPTTSTYVRNMHAAVIKHFENTRPSLRREQKTGRKDETLRTQRTLAVPDAPASVHPHRTGK